MTAVHVCVTSELLTSFSYSRIVVPFVLVAFVATLQKETPVVVGEVLSQVVQDGEVMGAFWRSGQLTESVRCIQTVPVHSFYGCAVVENQPDV